MTLHYKKLGFFQHRHTLAYILESVGKGSVEVHIVIGKKFGSGASEEQFLTRKRKGVENDLLPTLLMSMDEAQRQ